MTSTGMREWARRQMRLCSCGRKYIAPRAGNRQSFAWYRSERTRLDLCWRCERSLTPAGPTPESNKGENK